MEPSLQFLFSCVHGKTASVPKSRRIHSYEMYPPDELVGRWKTATRLASDAIKVCDLYSGRVDGYWGVARSIMESPRFRVFGKVMSAGFGLADWDSLAVPYSARFARVRRNDGTPSDLIPNGTAVGGRRWWWDQMGGRNDLKAIFDDKPARMIVVLPEMYLEIALPDLLHIQAKHGVGRMVVFTSHTESLKRLGNDAVSVNKGMHKRLGGNGWTTGALTALAARFVLRQIDSPDQFTAARSRLLLREVDLSTRFAR